MKGQPLASDEKRLQAEGFVQLVHRLVRGALGEALGRFENLGQDVDVANGVQEEASTTKDPADRKIDGRWSVSGSYQVLAVCCRSPQGARVMALIVWMATPLLADLDKGLEILHVGGVSRHRVVVGQQHRVERIFAQ